MEDLIVDPTAQVVDDLMTTGGSALLAVANALSNRLAPDPGELERFIAANRAAQAMLEELMAYMIRKHPLALPTITVRAHTRLLSALQDEEPSK